MLDLNKLAVREGSLQAVRNTSSQGLLEQLEIADNELIPVDKDHLQFILG